MPRRGAHGVERELFARVINAWLKDGQDHPGPRGALAPTLEAFTVRHHTLALLTKDRDVNLVSEDAWIVGRPIEPHQPLIFPVVSAALQTEDDRLMGTVRVALLYEGTDRVVDVMGWRFESPEKRDLDPDAGNTPKPHTFPHAQPCSSWRPRELCMIHPDAVAEDEDVDGCPSCFMENPPGTPARPAIPSHTRPAFPLRCHTLPGLAVAAIAAFYGTHIARDILSTDTVLDSCGAEFAADFRYILGEPEPELAA